jgi:NTE family protein
MDLALALGGGGAKGIAHVGVLRALERAGYRVGAIAGTSAGGLYGAFYAAGYTPDEIENHLCETDYGRLYGRQPGEGPAMLGLSSVHRLIQSQLGDRTFADLRLPFAVTAVDLNNAELLALKSGDLCEALMATIAVPGIFPPKVLGGRMLIDGGVLDPVPVGLARSLAPRLPVVAVVLSPPITDWVSRNRSPRLLNSLPFLAQYLGRLRIAQALNIFLRSVDMGGAMLTDLRLQLDQPEVIIRPDVAQVGLLDVVSVPDLIRLGEQAAERALPQLRRAVEWPARITHHLRRMMPPGKFHFPEYSLQ